MLTFKVLVGKIEPTVLYTWDMWLGSPAVQPWAGCHPLAPLSALNSNPYSDLRNPASAVLPGRHKDYIQLFKSGVDQYLARISH